MRKPTITTLAFAACAIAWLVIVLSSSLKITPPREVMASGEELEFFAKNTLDDLQARSFKENREFCGMILEDGAGELSTSDISGGTDSECEISSAVPYGKFAVASFHTHGSFGNDYDSEAPSLIDMNARVIPQAGHSKPINILAVQLSGNGTSMPGK